MRTRKYAESRNEVLGELWFNATYAVPIFFKEAVIRWIQSNSSVVNHSGQEPYRLLKVRTLSENNLYAKNRNQIKAQPIQTNKGTV